MATCPFCFGAISVEARKCKHCGEWVQQPQQAGGSTSNASHDPWEYCELDYSAKIAEESRKKWFGSETPRIMEVYWFAVSRPGNNIIKTSRTIRCQARLFTPEGSSNFWSDMPEEKPTHVLGDEFRAAMLAEGWEPLDPFDHRPTKLRRRKR